MCFVERVQSANEFFLEGHAAAMSSGDMNTAIMSRLLYSVCSFWAGTNLQQVKENFLTSRRMMEKQNNVVWLAHQGPLEISMLMLIGTNEREMPKSPDLGNASPHASMIVYFNKTYQW